MKKTECAYMRECVYLEKEEHDEYVSACGNTCMGVCVRSCNEKRENARERRTVEFKKKKEKCVRFYARSRYACVSEW